MIASTSSVFAFSRVFSIAVLAAIGLARREHGQSPLDAMLAIVREPAEGLDELGCASYAWHYYFRFGLGQKAYGDRYRKGLDALRRTLTGTEPVGPTMMVLAVIAAVINLICLMLIRRQQSSDVNMKAAETFSFNDFASNGGILIAGGLVLWLDQSWPDLVVGLIVAGIAVKGGVDILRDSRAETRAGEEA